MAKKKSMGLMLIEKKKQIDIVNPLLSVREQCNLLGFIARVFIINQKPWMLTIWN